MITAFERPGLSGFLHTPATAGDGLVLTHGAGANCAAALLVRIATSLCDRGLSVLRCDMAFRQRRPKGPPFPGAAQADRDSLRDAVAAMRGLVPGRVLLGGHSYGGRQASMLAAQEPQVADGLLLLSYPLHPPTQPERLRTEHFPKLRTRTAIVHGDRDPFGSIEALEAAMATIPAPVRLFAVPACGHDLKGLQDQVAQAVAFLLAA